MEANTRITATIQGVEEVLNPSYIPKNQDKKLYYQKSRSIRFKLHSKVQTDKGKALIRLHTDNLDAQKVFSALKIYGDKSISAKINASDLLIYVTSSKINDGTWRGASTGYIGH